MAAPATSSNCNSPAVPLGPSARWRGGTCCKDNRLPPISECPDYFCPHHHPSFAIRLVSTQHGKQQIPVISLHSISVEWGCLRGWERISLDSYRLPQAGQPPNPGGVPPGSVLSIGCIGIRRTSNRRIVNYRTRLQQEIIKKETSSKTDILECPDNDARLFSRPSGHQ